MVGQQTCCCGEGETNGTHTTICNLHITSWVCCTPALHTTTPLNVKLHVSQLLQPLFTVRSGDVALMPAKIKWTSRTSMRLQRCFIWVPFKSWSYWQKSYWSCWFEIHFNLRPPNYPEDCWNVWHVLIIPPLAAPLESACEGKLARARRPLPALGPGKVVWSLQQQTLQIHVPQANYTTHRTNIWI